MEPNSLSSFVTSLWSPLPLESARIKMCGIVDGCCKFTNTNSTKMLEQPGQVIRPVMTTEKARQLVEELYGFTVTNIKELNSYVDRNYKIEVAADFRNPNIKSLWPDGYILKVLNSMETPKEHVLAEHEVQALLWEGGVQCPQPIPDLEGRKFSRQEFSSEVEANGDYGPMTEKHRFTYHLVRMLKFIAGDIMADHDPEPRLLQETGSFVAKVQIMIKDFTHPALKDFYTVWNIQEVPRMTEFLYAVHDASKVQLVEEVINAFKQQVLPNLHTFQAGTIHGDMNEQNILVKFVTNDFEKSELAIAGIIDFGEMEESYLVFDLAICIMYMSVICKTKTDALLAGGYVLAGYLRDVSLNEDEWRALRVCVAGRYCQSLVMGAYSHSLEPDNDYLLATADAGWGQLERFWRTSKEQLYTKWFRTIREANSNAILPPIGTIL